MRWHGVLRDDQGRALDFRFPTLKIFEAVHATWYVSPMVGGPPAPKWPYRDLDVAFDRGVARLRQAFFSLERACRRSMQCIEILEDQEKQPRDGMPIEHAAEWFEAHEDVHLFLDLALHYVYDYADGIVLVLCRLLPDGRLHANDRSFRKHLTSLSQGAVTDTTYTRIMLDHSDWFSLLAADLKDPAPGARTMLVHGHGRPSDFKLPYGQRVDGLAAILDGFFRMHDALLPWLTSRVEHLAEAGTQLRVILDSNPSFVDYPEPAGGIVLFSNPLFPDASR